MGSRPMIELTLSVGDVVDGRYTLLELLGEGAAGKVFRAQDRGHNDRFVALKLLHAKDPRWENFFRREFEVLSKLEHPNLVRVYDFGTAPADNTFYFTQELVVGSPLLKVVSGRKVDEVCGLFIEICRALEFIHAHGVLHRDLKPANILVHRHAEPGNRVRVLDFGLWRELETKPQKGARWAGTPPYLASEVLAGNGHSICADLYAVGVTLYQAITRKLPHGRGTPQELLAARKTPIESLSGIVPEPLAKLVARLLAEKPADRPQSGDEVAQALSVLVPNYQQKMPLILGKARLVGRENEWKSIEKFLESIKKNENGTEHLIVISAPKGMGKSRLLQAIKTQTQLTGGHSAIGACEEYLTWGYRPIADLVLALSSQLKESELSTEERRMVQLLCPQTGYSSSELNFLQNKEEKKQFIITVASFLLARAAKEFFIICIDDLMYCDSLSLKILERVLRKAAGHKIAMVVTVATEQDTRGRLNQLLKACQNFHLTLRLDELDRHDIARLVAALLGVSKVPTEVVDSVCAHAGGNPRLIENLVALFVDTKQLQRVGNQWKLSGVLALNETQYLDKSMIKRHYMRLNEKQRQVVFALAILNRPVDSKMIAALAETEQLSLPMSAVQDILEVLEAMHLVKSIGSQHGRKSYVLGQYHLRDAILGELKKSKSYEVWHQRCAQLLEQKAYDPSGGLASVLADHYAEAGKYKNAFKWHLKASNRALKQRKYKEMYQFLQKALRHQDKVSIDSRALLLAQLLLAQAFYFLGEVLKAKIYLEGLLAEVKIADAPTFIAPLYLLWVKSCLEYGVYRHCLSQVNVAMSELDADEDEAKAIIYLARAKLLSQDNPAMAEKNAKKAIKRLKRSDARIELQLDAFCILAESYASIGKFEKSLAYIEKSYNYSQKHNLLYDEIIAGRLYAKVLSSLGNRLKARSILNQCYDYCKKGAFPLEQGLIIKELGMQLYISGAYPEANSRFQQAATLCSKYGQLEARAEALKYLGQSYRSKGDYDRSIHHLNVALDAFRHIGQKLHLVSTQCELTLSYLARGDIDLAEELLQAAVEQQSDGNLSNQVKALVFAAQGEYFSAKAQFKRSRLALLNASFYYRISSDNFSLAQTLMRYALLLLRFKHVKRALRMAKRAQALFLSMDAKGELKRLQPLINAAEGLAKIEAKRNK